MIYPLKIFFNIFLVQRNLSWLPFATEKTELIQAPMHAQEIFCGVTTFTNLLITEPARSSYDLHESCFWPYI
jgi:hypothetical protein